VERVHCLLLNGAAHGAWPSAALNLVWLAVGVVALRKVPSRKPPVPG